MAGNSQNKTFYFLLQILPNVFLPLNQVWLGMVQDSCGMFRGTTLREKSD